MTKPITKMLPCFLLLYFTNLQAAWLDDHERGWHWYEKHEEEIKTEPKASATVQSSYASRLKKYREEGEELRAKAVMERDPESVRALIAWENTMWNNAEHFGSVWQAVLRSNPEYDYSVTHPTTQYARSLYLDEQKKKIKGAIETLKNNYGLVFFFKENCTYCHAMAPIITSIASRHGLILQGISLDGGSIPVLPAIKSDNGLSQRFNVTMVPAIFAVNPATGEYFPIATGAISEQEIEERIYQIAEYHSEVEGKNNSNAHKVN